jgi:hypothetical protein
MSRDEFRGLKKRERQCSRNTSSPSAAPTGLIVLMGGPFREITNIDVMKMALQRQKATLRP